MGAPPESINELYEALSARDVSLTDKASMKRFRDLLRKVGACTRQDAAVAAYALPRLLPITQGYDKEKKDLIHAQLALAAHDDANVRKTALTGLPMLYPHANSEVAARFLISLADPAISDYVGSKVAREFERFADEEEFLLAIPRAIEQANPDGMGALLDWIVRHVKFGRDGSRILKGVLAATVTACPVMALRLYGSMGIRKMLRDAPGLVEDVLSVVRQKLEEDFGGCLRFIPALVEESRFLDPPDQRQVLTVVRDLILPRDVPDSTGLRLLRALTRVLDAAPEGLLTAVCQNVVMRWPVAGGLNFSICEAALWVMAKLMRQYPREAGSACGLQIVLTGQPHELAPHGDEALREQFVARLAHVRRVAIGFLEATAVQAKSPEHQKETGDASLNAARRSADSARKLTDLMLDDNPLRRRLEPPSWEPPNPAAKKPKENDRAEKKPPQQRREKR